MSDDIADLRRSMEQLRVENVSLRGLVQQMATALCAVESETAATRGIVAAVQKVVSPMVRFSTTMKHADIDVMGAVLTKAHGTANAWISVNLDEPTLRQGRVLRMFRPLVVTSNHCMVEVMTSATVSYGTYAGTAAKASGFSFYCANAHLYRNNTSALYDAKIGAVGSPTLIGVEVYANNKRPIL